jgi:hypothetical protein
MPPRRFSRHSFTLGITDSVVRTLLTDRVTFQFRTLADNIQHVVEEGDSLYTLAAKYYRGLPRPSGLWWVIADFQPNPVHDPTLKLEVGRVLIIPSLRTVQEELFSEERRLESAV